MSVSVTCYFARRHADGRVSILKETHPQSGTFVNVSAAIDACHHAPHDEHAHEVRLRLKPSVRVGGEPPEGDVA